MKLLAAAFFLLCASLIPARADCPSWTIPSPIGAWDCYYLPDGTFTCTQLIECLNPDGSLSTSGDSWTSLAYVYELVYGYVPDVDDIEAFYISG